MKEVIKEGIGVFIGCIVGTLAGLGLANIIIGILR